MATQLHEQALGNANVQNFLRMLATAEGTLKNGADPYRVGFGGSQIADLSAHPNIVKSFRQTDGKMNKTSAAGAYQFLNKTWTPLQQQLGLKDFSPRSQDIAAIELIRQAGALDDITRGNYGNAIKKTGRIWASLPSSPHAQPKRSSSFIEKALGISSAHAGTLPPQPMKPQKDKWDALVEEFSTPQQAPQQAGQGAPAQQPMQQQAAPQADKWDALVKEFSAPPQPAPNQAPVAPVRIQQPAPVQKPVQQAQSGGKMSASNMLLKATIPFVSSAATKPSGKLSAVDRIMYGIFDPVDGITQLASKAIPDSISKPANKLNNWIADRSGGLIARMPEGGADQFSRDREKAYQARRAEAGQSGFDGMRMVGNIISPVNKAIDGFLPSVGTMPAQVLKGAAGGLLSAAAQPVAQGDFASEKIKNMGSGAAFGAAMPVVTAGIGRVISPNASRNPDLKKLRDAGVRPTVGQTLGGRWNAAEEKLTSMPLVGDMIANRRGAVLRDFNKAVINDVGESIGAKASGVGTEAIAEMSEHASKAQEAARNALGAFQIDDVAAKELANIASMAQSIPDNRAKKSVFDMLNLVKNQASGGVILPEGYRDLHSKLAASASDLTGSTDAYQKQAGHAIAELKAILEESAMRQNPEAAKALKAANIAWAKQVRLDKAGGKAVSGANGNGVFTPSQLLASIRESDSSVRKRAVAHGKGLMQELAMAGNNVIGNKVPNSGTADRALLPTLGLLGSTAISPAKTIALTVGGAGMYTDPMQRLLTGAITSRPESAQAAREIVNRSSPFLIPAAGEFGRLFIGGE